MELVRSSSIVQRQTTSDQLSMSLLGRSLEDDEGNRSPLLNLSLSSMSSSSSPAGVVSPTVGLYRRSRFSSRSSEGSLSDDDDDAEEAVGSKGTSIYSDLEDLPELSCSPGASRRWRSVSPSRVKPSTQNELKPQNDELEDVPLSPGSGLSLLTCDIKVRHVSFFVSPPLLHLLLLSLLQQMPLCSSSSHPSLSLSLSEKVFILAVMCFCRSFAAHFLVFIWSLARYCLTGLTAVGEL